MLKPKNYDKQKAIITANGLEEEQKAISVAFLPLRGTAPEGELLERIEAFNAKCVELGATLMTFRTK